MIYCNGKINSYGNNGLLDIYNLLTYKFYNEGKGIINEDYIAFLKKNTKLDKQLESIMKKRKITNYKTMITKVENILNNRIDLLNKLNKKIKLFISIDKSYSNFKQMSSEINNINLTKQKLHMESLLTELLEGNSTIVNKNEYSLYKYTDEFFDITKEQSEQLVLDVSFRNILKSKNNTILKKFITEIDEELKENKYIQNTINKMNTIVYISPYTNMTNQNKLSIEIDSITNHKKFIQDKNLSKFIKKKAYPIVEPIIVYKDNEIYEIRTVYSPKIWTINDNFDEIYAKIFTYIKFNYLFNIKDIRVIKKLNSSIRALDCQKSLRNKYDNCNQNLTNKKQTKSELENKMISIHRLLSNIYENNTDIFNNKEFTDSFIFSQYAEKTKKNVSIDTILTNNLYKILLQRTQDEIHDTILSELDKSAFNILIHQTGNKSIVIEENKLQNSHKNKNKNKNLKKMIKIKQNNLFDNLFGHPRIIDDEILEIQRRKKFVLKFINRYDREVNDFVESLNKALFLNQELTSKKDTKKIITNLIERNSINNNLNQEFTKLLVNGKILHQQLQIDLNFIKKTNNFIERLVTDLFKIKSSITQNINKFGKTIEHILVKKPIDLEFTRETFELINNEDIELDYFDYEVFYVLLSYLNQIKSDGDIVNKIYNLLTHFKEMIPKIGHNFNCFEDINHIVNLNNDTFNYKPYVWMWPKNISNKWIRVGKETVNHRKNFILTYPHILTKNSEFTKKEDLYPCILKWLSEDDMIFVEMSKNFKSAKDNESLKVLLNTIDFDKVKELFLKMNDLNILSNILEKNGVNIIYKSNNKKQTKKCLLPNKVTIEDELINTKRWKTILKLENDIQYYFTQIKINALIQVSLLEMLTDIKKNRGKNINTNRIQKISFNLFMKKIVQFISFLYEIHIEKFMTKQKQKHETHRKNSIQSEYDNEDIIDDTQEEDFITLLDDIF